MTDAVWAPGDRIKFVDRDGRLEYGTVLSIDGDKVYASLDGYPKAVKGCFHAESTYVTKVVHKKKGRKK